jgi:hypothetical protein
LDKLPLNKNYGADCTKEPPAAIHQSPVYYSQGVLFTVLAHYCVVLFRAGPQGFVRGCLFAPQFLKQRRQGFPVDVSTCCRHCYSLAFTLKKKKKGRRVVFGGWVLSSIDVWWLGVLLIVGDFRCGLSTVLTRWQVYC